ncbi:MAG: mannitol dehydrogenase family protein [Microthrixaceae bacterium]
MSVPPRLSAATIAPEAAPPYDRGSEPRVVHLGVGAFARAHLGEYADDLLRGGHDALVHGVSLRNPTAEQQLAPQDGLHTSTVREPGRSGAPRVLGAFVRVSTGASAAIEALASPHTTTVTLTVTEKGYAADAAPAVLAAGLERRGRDLPAPVVLSLDNLADNGSLLRTRVLEAARSRDPRLAEWIAASVPFPSSVVDRMVPATTAADLDEVERRIGRRDEGAVVAEHHRSWILERAGTDGRVPPLDTVGVELVDDIGPYQRRKLWLLNLPHSALAYAGLLAGCDTIAAATEHPVVAAFADAVLADAVQVADVPDAAAFAAGSVRRFRNGALGHTCRQVGADGSQKLPQRLLPVAEARRGRGWGTERLAAVVALWSAAVDGVPLGGRVLPPVQDRSRVLDGATPELLAEVATARRALERGGLDVLGELV